MKTKSNVIDFRQVAANVAAAEAALNTLVPAFDGSAVHDKVLAANASLFSQAYFSEPLTTYAAGWKDGTNLDEEIAFLAPPVKVPRKFEYAANTNFEEFLADTDDLRAIGSNFKDVTYSGSKVTASTQNRGLTITVDLDEVADKDGWRNEFTGKLMRRLKRNQLKRAAALLAAAATNTAKTWDTTAGKDPDQDVIADLITAANVTGIKPNRVAYGDTAWSKRLLAHRAQSSAGGFSSAGMTPDQVAGLLGVEKVLHSNARYSSSTTAKTEIIANLVLMFFAQDNMDTEDSSNIKRFWSPTEGGGEFRVYEQQLTEKLYRITVECYELLKVTSTSGIRKFTVS